jgi:hypothetical protein
MHQKDIERRQSALKCIVHILERKGPFIPIYEDLFQNLSEIILHLSESSLQSEVDHTSQHHDISLSLEMDSIKALSFAFPLDSSIQGKCFYSWIYVFFSALLHLSLSMFEVMYLKTFLDLVVMRLPHRPWSLRQTLLQATQVVWERSTHVTLNQDPSICSAMIEIIAKDTLLDPKYVIIRSQSLRTIQALVDKIDRQQASTWLPCVTSLLNILEQISATDKDSSIRAASRSLLLSLSDRIH